MRKKYITALICLFTLSLTMAACSSNPSSSSASPSASPAASSSASPSVSPSPSASPDGFIMGTVTEISGNTITLSVVTHDNNTTATTTKQITVDSNTAFAISGSKKTAALSDISKGDVITASLSGTTALKIIDDGPGVNPDPSSYIPSPSPSSDTTSPTPSASS